MKQKKKLLLTACVGGALSVIWLAVSLFSREPLTSLIRPENGEGDRKEKLEVWIGEEPYSIEVTVRERPEDRSGDCRRTAESRRWDGTIVSGRKPGSGAYYGKGKHAVRISRNRHCHSVVLKFMGVHISGRYREKRRVYQS